MKFAKCDETSRSFNVSRRFSIRQAHMTRGLHHFQIRIVFAFPNQNSAPVERDDNTDCYTCNVMEPLATVCWSEGHDSENSKRWRI